MMKAEDTTVRSEARKRVGLVAAPHLHLAPRTRNRVEASRGDVVDGVPARVVFHLPNAGNGAAHVNEHLLHGKLEFRVGLHRGLAHLGYGNPARVATRFAHAYGLVAVVVEAAGARKLEIFLDGAPFLVGHARAVTREQERDVLAHHLVGHEYPVTLLYNRVTREIALGRYRVEVDMQRIVVPNKGNVFQVRGRERAARLPDKVAQARLRVLPATFTEPHSSIAT